MVYSQTGIMCINRMPSQFQPPPRIEAASDKGKKGTSCLVTHVERKTGYVVVGRFGRQAIGDVQRRLSVCASGHFLALIRTLMTDNSGEFSGHKQLGKWLSCEIYSAAPGSP